MSRAFMAWNQEQRTRRAHMMGFPTFPGPPQGKGRSGMKALPPVVIMCSTMPKEGGVLKRTVLVGAKGGYFGNSLLYYEGVTWCKVCNLCPRWRITT